jgi:hypothetical protein
MNHLKSYAFALVFSGLLGFWLSFHAPPWECIQKTLPTDELRRSRPERASPFFPRRSERGVAATELVNFPARKPALPLWRVQIRHAGNWDKEVSNQRDQEKANRNTPVPRGIVKETRFRLRGLSECGTAGGGVTTFVLLNNKKP